MTGIVVFALVALTVAAEVGLPLAIAFYAGRRWERRRIERSFARQVVGVALHDADAGEPLQIDLGRRLGVAPDPPVKLPPSFREGIGFPKSRRRK